MCRVLQVELPLHASSPARARHVVVDTLRTWDMHRQTDLQDNAVLLTNELVTNAVLHAHTPAQLVIAAANGTLEIGVTDLSSRIPRRRHVPPIAGGLSTHGRGLELLEGLADDWGVVPLSVGKQAWFRLHTPDWPWANACACAGDDLPRVRLGSGKYVGGPSHEALAGSAPRGVLGAPQALDGARSSTHRDRGRGRK